MRVLLVQQDSGRRKSPPLFPIGLSYIATALLQDHQVKILDPNVYPFPYAFEELKKVLKDFEPDIVGISIRDYDTTQKLDLFVNFKTIAPTVKIVKEINPKTKVIVGGAGFSIFAKKIMERVTEIDFGIFLEGEESTPELLKNFDSVEEVKGIFFRKDGKVYFTGPRQLLDFNSLAMPKRDIEGIDIKNYLGPFRSNIGLQSKRGCAFKCIYCSYPFLNGPHLRLRDPKNVVDEIEYLVNNFNVKYFTFVDSIFNIPERHAKDICKEIIKRKVSVEFEGWFDLKHFSEDLMTLAKEAGCRHVGFSPDAATDKGLLELKKNITVKDIERSLQILRKMKGITAGYDLFCSYPGQNLTGIIKAIWYYFKVPIYLSGKGMVHLCWIRIEPHTDIFQTSIKQGLIAENTELLAEDEKALSKLFYYPSSQWYAHFLSHILLKTTKAVKPLLKLLFRVIARAIGKKPLYNVSK